MANAVVTLHVRDAELSEEVRGKLEERCRSVADQFPELNHVEVTLTGDGAGLAASAHATGKATEAATHATGDQPAPTVAQVLDKLAHQLRRQHDKRIFARRRDARAHRRDEPTTESN